MKVNLSSKTVVAGILTTFLFVPNLVNAADLKVVADNNVEVIPIRYEYSHWAQATVENLTKNYDIGLVFENKHLNDFITVEDFKTLIKKTINNHYEGVPDSITREAVVYEFAKIWAQELNEDLDMIPTIKMLIYSDTDKIDSKYNHGITVAYMKNIAKGKGMGTFDPKAKVTYGELATLINNTITAIEETKSNNQNINDESFETRGSYEIKDEEVILNFELINHHSSPKDLMFSSGQQFEIYIVDEEGKEVYRYSEGKFFTMALIYKSINSGESLTWQDKWDMTNKEGEKVQSGKYKAIIKILGSVN